MLNHKVNIRLHSDMHFLKYNLLIGPSRVQYLLCGIIVIFFHTLFVFCYLSLFSPPQYITLNLSSSGKPRSSVSIKYLIKGNVQGSSLNTKNVDSDKKNLISTHSLISNNSLVDHKLSVTEIHNTNEVGGGGDLDESGTQESTVNSNDIYSQRNHDYFKKIIAEIARNTKYPEEARLKNLSGLVNIKFKIHRDGSISNIRVDNSTADLILQRQAEFIIKSIDKKLAIPPEVNLDYIWLVIPINFNLNK